jgi:uncharacterized protein (TIRG00374 family)
MAWFKRLLSLILFIILLILFWPLAKELKNLGLVFRQASWGWLGVAVLIQVISYAFLTELNRLLLRPFPGAIGFLRMMAVLPALAFIEVTVPSAGASGVVLRARLLGKNGYSVEASTFTLVMETLYVGVMMFVVSFMGLWYLVRAGEIHRVQIFLLIGISVILLISGLLAMWFARDRKRVGNLALRFNALADRVLSRFNRPAPDEQQVRNRVEAFYDGLSQLRHYPIWPFLFTSLGRVVLDVASLGACFLAFNYFISFGVLLTGYGLMLLLSGLASLPGGLGMADLSLSVIYARLGAPGAVAVAAALSYRLIAWWLLRFIGFVSWQVLEARRA